MSRPNKNTNNTNTNLAQQALSVANLAVTEDGKGNFEMAKNYYVKVIQLFEQIIIKDESNSQNKNTAILKCQEYKKRVEKLNNILSVETLLNDAQTLLARANEQDAQKNYQEALDLYTSVVEHYIKAIKETRDENLKASLTVKVKGLLDRAENIKGVPMKTVSLLNVQSASAESTCSGCSVSDSKLTATEQEILFKTSHINGKIYYPWLETDLQEQFTYNKPFLDPEGTMKLSDKQQANFGAWRRPSELTETPKMIAMISSKNIIQDIVTDCSFVASLCVAAAYERKFKKPAMVDDLLPVSRGEKKLMCTYSSNENEFWPSIIEKAYMKLMGGYDFPGSALTGWFPENIFINDSGFNRAWKKNMDDQNYCSDFNKRHNTWKRIRDGQNYGDALITIATGSMTDEEADLVGLVPTHAYAVLDAKEVNDLCLLKVKNPWSHKCWTGSYSHLDETSWTKELMTLLDYDRVKARDKDDGIFWIDFDSVWKHFASIHMNWNPELFSYRYTLHSSWPKSDSMHSDCLNLSNNPQYALEIQNPEKEPCAVFLLLTKHITEIKKNEDYITLHVYNCDNSSGSSNRLDTIATFGEKIYYPGIPYLEGMFLNSPHILVHFIAPTGTTRYTVVVAQLKKMNSMDFTLRCYCISPFTLHEVPQKYPIEKKIAGQWTPLTAGGSKAHITYLNNPQYRVSIPHSSNNTPRLLIMLEGPKNFAVHVEIVWGRGKRIASISAKDILSRSGDYRDGFCYCEVEDIQPGDYTIILSTFEPGLCGDFLLTVGSNAIGFSVVPIPAEGAGMFKKVITGKWIDGVNAMGRPNFGEYHRNPCYYLYLKEMTTIKVRLQTPHIKPIPTTNIRIFEKHATTKFGREVASSGPYTNYTQGAYIEEVTLPPHGYVIVFSTWEKGITGNFVALLYSDRPVEVEKDCQ
ncbi:9192_t:CDS:10 [Ambispora gerdemannii]|uniref:9192_t:CDS:1 n=1 Tax=Ambispora gerdemannii TaxID=144530 RepID=A0A9N8W8Z6_9GLOM|nr:9192_t:CDS:10 [Ambispora gerdemannii]